MNGVPFSRPPIHPNLGRISSGNTAHFCPPPIYRSSEQSPPSLGWLASDLERVARLSTLPPQGSLLDGVDFDDFDTGPSSSNGSFGFGVRDPFSARDQQITRTELSRSYLSRRDDSLSIRSTHNECDNSERAEWRIADVMDRPPSAQSNRSTQSNLSDSSFKELMGEVATRVGRAMVPRAILERLRGGNRLGTSQPGSERPRPE